MYLSYTTKNLYLLHLVLFNLLKIFFLHTVENLTSKSYLEENVNFLGPKSLGKGMILLDQIISFALANCQVKVLISHVRLFVTPWTVAFPGSSVHGISQARILEWVVIPFSRGSSWPRDRTWVSYFAGRFFTPWATREASYGTV